MPLIFDAQTRRLLSSRARDKLGSKIEISSATGQLQAVLAGAGIGILHDYLAAGQPSLKLLLPSLRVDRTYWTVMHESMRDNARVRAVADFLGSAVLGKGTPFIR